jgi:hypothetical protein
LGLRIRIESLAELTDHGDVVVAVVHFAGIVQSLVNVSPAIVSGGTCSRLRCSSGMFRALLDALVLTNFCGFASFWSSPFPPLLIDILGAIQGADWAQLLRCSGT